MVLDLNVTPLHKYYIVNRVSLSQDYSANRYVLGLLNELLFIIVGQGAAKLSPVKFGGPLLKYLNLNLLC